MSEAALDRPTLRVPFRWLIAIALGLAVVAFFAGRHIFQRYGGYRPLALMHVPPTMRYRARISMKDDPKRFAAASLVLGGLDQRLTRGPELERKLGGILAEATHELAFGVGKTPSEFVVVVGLKLDDGATLRVAQTACEVARAENLPLTATERGCRFADGSLLAATPDGTVVLASHVALVEHLLARPEIGDRMGFAGPSVRGAAPELKELTREAAALSQALRARYP